MKNTCYRRRQMFQGHLSAESPAARARQMVLVLSVVPQLPSYDLLLPDQMFQCFTMHDVYIYSIYTVAICASGD